MSIIREHINFERGIDPKKAMRIGLVQKWLSLKKGDILKIIKRFTTDSQHEIRSDSRYHIFPKGNYLQISNTESELFDDGCIGFTAYLGDKSTRSVDDIFIWGTPLQLEKVLELVPRIQEAQNFTRGVEPKKSMDIGQTHLDKKFIEETEWWVKYNPEEYEIIDFIKDYRGYFILLMSSKCTENIQVEKENYFRGETYYLGTSTHITELGGKVAKTPEKALLKIKDDIDEYIEQLPEMLSMLESYNFTREGDSLPKMGIGKYRFPSKMGGKEKGYESLYNDGEWSIEKYFMPITGNYNLVVVVESEDLNMTDWACMYDDGRIAYDNPYSIPDNIKEMVKHLYHKIRGFNESVNFERGIEPKSAMTIGIGLSALIKGIPAKIFKEDKKNQFFSGAALHKGAIVAIYFSPPEGAFHPSFPCEKLIMKFYLSDYNDHLIGEAKIAYAIKLINAVGLTSYFEDSANWDDSSPSTNVSFKIKEEFQKYFKKSYFSQEDYNSIKESLNFQRGMEPKKAMKIGKYTRPYKKGDKVKVWIPNEKRLVELRINEDEDADSDGNPITKTMISNKKPAWKVRRIWVRYLGEIRTANYAIQPENPDEDKWIMHQ